MAECDERWLPFWKRRWSAMKFGLRTLFESIFRTPPTSNFTKCPPLLRRLEYAHRMRVERVRPMHINAAHWGEAQELAIATRLYGFNFVTIDPSTDQLSPPAIHRFPHPVDNAPVENFIGPLDPAVPTAALQFIDRGHYQAVTGLSIVPEAEWQLGRSPDRPIIGVADPPRINHIVISLL